MFKIDNNDNNINESTFVHSAPSSNVNAMNNENTSVNVDELSESLDCTNRYQVLINDVESDFDKSLKTM